MLWSFSLTCCMKAFVVSRVFHDRFLLVLLLLVLLLLLLLLFVFVLLSRVVLSVAATGTGRGVAGAVSNHVMHVVGPVRIVLNFHEVSMKVVVASRSAKPRCGRPVQLYPQILRHKPRFETLPETFFAQRRRSNHCSWRRAKL